MHIATLGTNYVEDGGWFPSTVTGRQHWTTRWPEERRGGALILKLRAVVIQQDVPALDLLVFVLEALVPVFQTLPFGLDAQLASSCRRTGRSARTR